MPIVPVPMTVNINIGIGAAPPPPPPTLREKLGKAIVPGAVAVVGSALVWRRITKASKSQQQRIKNNNNNNNSSYFNFKRQPNNSKTIDNHDKSPSSSSCWNVVKNTTKNTALAASNATHRTKLRSDILWLERSIQQRKRQFGIESHALIATLDIEQGETFWSYRQTSNIRQPFYNIKFKIQEYNGRINSKREQIRFLQDKKQQLAAESASSTTTETESEASSEASNVIPEQQQQHQEATEQAENTTTTTPTSNMSLVIKEQYKSLRQSAQFLMDETKLKREISAMEHKITTVMEEFGIELYDTINDLEVNQKWLPSDVDIRNLYENAKKDIEDINNTKQEKEQELSSDNNDTNNDNA